MKIEDVYSVEDLNIWSLTSGKSTAIVHMQLSMFLMVNVGLPRVCGLLSLELNI
jgi:Co/Zn/Cd efflux system component